MPESREPTRDNVRGVIADQLDAYDVEEIADAGFSEEAAEAIIKEIEHAGWRIVKAE